jgi:hypothetical protein
MMTNYHSSEWIMERMKKIYKYCTDFYYEESHIVGLFYYGSANYGLDTQESDIDTCLLVIPNVEEIIDKRKISFETVGEYGHIVVKDVRDWYDSFIKPSIVMAECLFTDYKILNPKYIQFWEELVERREKFMEANKNGVKNNIIGHARAEAKKIAAERADYHKCFSHMLRLEYLLLNYLGTNNYETSSKYITWDQIKEVKEGAMTLEEIKSCADVLLKVFDGFMSIKFETPEEAEEVKIQGRELVNAMVKLSLKEDLEDW